MTQLTPQGLADRKWAWLPALRSILEAKRVPNRDNAALALDHLDIDQLHRLVEIEILVHEYRALIIDGLRSESRQVIEHDLHALQGALRQAQMRLRDSEKMLGDLEEQVRSIAYDDRWRS